MATDPRDTRAASVDMSAKGIERRLRDLARLYKLGMRIEQARRDPANREFCRESIGSKSRGRSRYHARPQSHTSE